MTHQFMRPHCCAFLVEPSHAVLSESLVSGWLTFLLTTCVFQIVPLHLCLRDVATNGRVYRGEEEIWPDLREQLVSLELILHRTLHFRKAKPRAPPRAPRPPAA